MRLGGLILIFILITVLSYSDSRRRLTWEPVSGASGYYLQIRDSARSIITEIAVKENYYETAGLDPGNYSFRVATINILQQKGESSPWINFTIEKLIVPELHSASIRQLVASVTSRDIIVKGNNFNRSSRFFLRSSGGDIPVTAVNVKSEREVYLAIKTDAGMAGLYDLVVVNRGGAEAVLSKAFRVVEKKVIEQNFFLAVAYSVNVPIGAWSEYFSPSFTGASLYFQIPFFLSGSAQYYFETELDVVRYNITGSTTASSFTFISSGAGISFYYLLKNPVHVFVKVLAGPVYNMIEMEGSSIEKRSSSVDLYATTGAGVRYFLTDNFFLEPAFYWRTVFMAEEFLHHSEISLYAGVRF